MRHQSERVEKAEAAFNAQPSPYPGAQLALTTASATHAGMAGERAPATAVSSGEVSLSGGELLGKKFAASFRVWTTARYRCPLTPQPQKMLARAHPPLPDPQHLTSYTPSPEHGQLLGRQSLWQ